jgi:hypothetical protein
MQSLLNEWRRFLTEESSPTARENVERFLEIAGGGPDTLLRQMLTFSGVDFDVYANQKSLIDLLRTNLVKTFDQIQPLVDNKIVKILGVGTKGIVFELDNGHALKLYKYSYQEGQEDFYDKESGKIFSGGAHMETLPIFGRGSVEIDGDEPLTLHWVEMAKVITFADYLELTGRDVDDLNLTSILRGAVDLAKALEDPDTPQDQLETLETEIGEYLDDAGIGQDEFVALFKMVAYVLEEYGPDYFMDFHEENFGVVEQTIGRKNLAFVLFDP